MYNRVGPMPVVDADNCWSRHQSSSMLPKPKVHSGRIVLHLVMRVVCLSSCMRSGDHFRTLAVPTADSLVPKV